jgi:hypothetical protein
MNTTELSNQIAEQIARGHAADRVICTVRTLQEADHLTRERGIPYKIGDDYMVELMPFEVEFHQTVRFIKSPAMDLEYIAPIVKSNKKWFHQFKK